MRDILDNAGIRRNEAAPATSFLEGLCDTLVGELLPERPADDAALLIARTHALAEDRVVSWDVPAEPAVVARARAPAARQLAARGLADATFPTEVIVSELLTNAIRNAKPPIRLRLILDDMLSCEVSDASNAAPHLRRADRYDEAGRGLMLVARLAERWGSRHTRTGKTIRAQQPLPPRPAVPRTPHARTPASPQAVRPCRAGHLAPASELRHRHTPGGWSAVAGGDRVGRHDGRGHDAPPRHDSHAHAGLGPVGQNAAQGDLAGVATSAPSISRHRRISAPGPM